MFFIGKLKESNFYITSIEPGGFGPHIDRMRNKILSSIDNKNIFVSIFSLDTIELRPSVSKIIQFFSSIR